MRTQIPSLSIVESDVDVLACVFFVDGQAAFELDFQKGFTVDVAGQKVCSVPIVAQAQAVEAIVGKARSDFLEVVVLFLAAVELVVTDLVKHLGVVIIDHSRYNKMSATVP